MKKIIIIIIFIFLCSQISFTQSWVQKINGIGMWSLAKDFSGRIYAGASGSVRSIYRSTNGGDSWDEVLSGGIANFLNIACDSSNNVYAANGSNGLMKSTNYGLNWNNIPISTFGNKNVQATECGKNGYLYIGMITGGIYISTDYGNTFPITALSGLTIVCITVDKFNSNIIYAGASSGTPPNLGFYRSTDAGLTFSADLNSLNIYAILEKSNQNLYTVTTSTGYAFCKSTNGGLNWVTVSNLSGAMRGACLDLMENIYTSGNGGVFKSTNDGINFTNCNFTYSSNQSLCFQNKILVAASGTSNGGVWIYTDSAISGIYPQNTNTSEKFILYQNYPNPFNPMTNVKWQMLKEGFVKIKLYDILGKEVSTLVNEYQNVGIYEIQFSINSITNKQISSGIYFYRLEISDESEQKVFFTDVKRMVLLK